MRTIRFKVNQQRIKNIDSTCHVYQGTDNYLCLNFSFSEDWNGCATGIVLGSKEIAMLLDENNNCVVPAKAFDEKQLTFYLVGKKDKYRIQTGPFVIKLGG